MTARDELRDHLVSGVNWGADELIDAYRDEVAIDLGRDLMKMGLVPFLERLVGADNTHRLFARHSGDA